MIRQAVGGIVTWKKQILLIEKVQISDAMNGQESIASEWDIPKGGVKATDDSLEEALLRELQEETGSTQYQIQSAYPHPITFTFPPDIQKKIGYTAQKTVLYLVHYTGDGTDLTPLDSEIRQVKFIAKEDVLEKLSHAETIQFIQSYALDDF